MPARFRLQRQQPIGTKARAVLLVLMLAAGSWAAYAWNQRVQVTLDSESEPALILGCEGRWVFYESNAAKRNRQVQYAPVAYTEDGAKAYGHPLLSKELCRTVIGNDVTVLKPSTPDSDHVFVSFLHFWALPIGLTVVAGLLALAALNVSATLMYLFLLPSVVGMGWMLLGELRSAPSGTFANASERALTLCIRRSLFDAGETEPEKLRRLLCQDPAVEELQLLENLTGLEELYLQNASLAWLSTLPRLPALRVISIASNKNLESLEGIENAPALQELQGNGAGLRTLDGIEHLTELRVLALMRNQLEGQALAPLAGLEKLESVVLNYNALTDLSPLANKPRLKELQVYSNRITDVSPLYANKSLEIVGLRGKGPVPCAQITRLREELGPSARVFGQEKCDPPRAQ